MECFYNEYVVNLFLVKAMYKLFKSVRLSFDICKLHFYPPVCFSVLSAVLFSSLILFSYMAWFSLLTVIQVYLFFITDNSSVDIMIN